MAEKKMKLSLDDLKVQSFVTTLTNAQQIGVNGGVTYTIRCRSDDDTSCQTDGTTCGTDTATMCTSLISCGTGADCTSADTGCGNTGFTCY